MTNLNGRPPMIEAAGLRIETVRENRYEFLSPRAQAAADKYGVTSVSVLATKPAMKILSAIETRTADHSFPVPTAAYSTSSVAI